MKSFKKLTSAAALIALLSMSNSTLAQQNTITFPELKDTYLKIGSFVNVDNLRNVGLGQTYHQIRLLLGNPHFSEGLGSPNAYNYVFNFYTNRPGGDYITCQYQVQFDDKRRVKGTYWKEKQCEQFVMEKPAVAPPQAIRLSADGLFAFGKSGLNDLQATGRKQLQDLAAQLNGYAKVKSVQVVGYTDRIGSPASNKALSLARANTVKQYLTSLGVNGAVIHTDGYGSNNPVVTCNGPKSPAVIQCLMPNRRIEVVVDAEK